MARAESGSILKRARALDAADKLARFRSEFCIPQIDNHPSIYLCGHSLGLMPRRARTKLEAEIDRWERRAVSGHFDDDGGWFAYHERFARPLARLGGARQNEVVAMNSLTVNLHLMLASFFEPTGQRVKILIEDDAFPSDRYAIESHLRWHGLDPEQALVHLHASDTAIGITADDLHAALRQHHGEIAVVWLPGVQYLSGQVLDMRSMTAVAHAHNALIGFDLAHAIGNVPLRLHRWDVDFAVWCSYKYLNGGPGAIGGCFVHARHGGPEQHRLAGWWGHAKTQRFSPTADFAPIPGAEGWQLSNPPIFAMAPLLAALEVFDSAGLALLQRKSRRLTRFLQTAIDTELGGSIEVITPRQAHGAQLSLRIAGTEHVNAVERALRAERITVDVREPNIMRLAPVPLYNRFRDVAHVVTALKRVLA